MSTEYASLLCSPAPVIPEAHKGVGSFALLLWAVQSDTAS